MGALLVAAQIQELIAVAHDAFPLFLEKGFKLCQILQDNRNRHPSGTHDAQNLVEVIRQRNIRKFVHDKVTMHGQAPAVLMVGKVEKLLE